MIADLFFEKMGYVDSIEKAREFCDELLKRVVAESRFMSDSDRETLLNKMFDYECMISESPSSGLYAYQYLTDVEVLHLANEYFGEHDEFIEKYKERLCPA